MTISVRAYIIINVRAIFREVIKISPAGRPKIENPKNVRLEIRLTQKENKLLEDCSKRMNATKTDVINEGIRLVKEKLDKK